MDERIQDGIQQGVGLMALGKYAEAKEVFQALLAVDDREPEVYLHLGNAQLDLDETDEGIASFKRALLLDETSIQALYSLGCAYFVKGDYASSLRYFNRLEDMGQTDADMYSIMAAMYLDANDYGMVIRCLNRAIQKEPLDAQLRLDKASAYVQMGRTRDAVASLHELQEILPDEAAGYELEARILIEADDEEGALAALDRSQARFPKDPRLVALKARAYNDMGRYDEALAEGMRGQDMGSDVQEVRNELDLQVGIALGGLGRIDESIAVLERSARDGAGAGAWYMIMSECLLTKDYGRVLEYARRIQAAEGDVEAHVMAAAVFNEPFALENLGRTEEAEPLYRAAITKLRRLTLGRNGLFEVYAYRALCLKALGEYDEALSLVDYLLKVDDTSAGTYSIRADVLDAAGRHEEARRDRERAKALDPDFDLGR